MARSSFSGDELRASVEARRDLGPDYEDSLVEGFLEKMDQEIDKRVDDRISTRARKESPAVRPSVDAGQRLTLAIISLVLGIPGTVGMSFDEAAQTPLIVILWVGIVGVNMAFALGGRRRSG